MQSTSKSKVFTYENGLLLLLGFTFGIVFFERNAIGPLAAYIIKDLGLNQAEIGMLGSGLSLAWAIAAYVIGAWSDRSGLRKPFLLVSVVVFSLCSALSGVAATFVMLLLARVIMGFAEGPFLPICFSIMNVESSPKRRGPSTSRSTTSRRGTAQRPGSPTRWRPRRRAESRSGWRSTRSRARTRPTLVR